MSDLLFEAVIFDLDGVVTQTALVHSAAWKMMFDDYLKERERKYGEPFIEFTHKGDYLQYVDGKPRYKGVESFLASRDIHIPYGKPDDSTALETICGIGNRKNEVFNKILKSDGVNVYATTVSLIRKLKKKGIRIGVASSSKNCEQVLKAAGIEGLFETRVDGVVSAELNLKGKPEPDIFTLACDNLGVDYDRTMVVEDAVSGVQAGAKGNFGLVLGLAREGNAHELLINGADIVVEDIGDFGLEGIEDWFRQGLEKDSWSITYNDYDAGKEKARETLLTIGNGYLGTRGAMEESNPGDVNYPGTYLAGLYNRRISEVAGKNIENEDFVNITNWLPVNFKIGNDPWMDINNWKVLSISRMLDMKQGILRRKMVVQDSIGRQTAIVSRRIASMHDPHIVALEYTIKPLNYSSHISLKTSLSGQHINAGVERYKQLDQQHLSTRDAGGTLNSMYLSMETTESGIIISTAVKILAFADSQAFTPDYQVHSEAGLSEIFFEHYLDQASALTIHKICSIYKSNDPGIEDPQLSAIKALNAYKSFDEVLIPSVNAWKKIWDEIDIRIEGDRQAQKLLRLHLYHLMVTTSPHNIYIDAGIPARGLHGEAYRGHIFWDELYIMPFYYMHFPEAARSVLMYRYRRLDAARKYAWEHGYKGAMFPWQSGSDGREETQVMHLNPVSGKWGADHSSLQRHVSLAIAYNIWNYYWYTNDLEFMQTYGMEMMIEISRFWASKTKFDKKSGRYNIDRVMGPDEFHEKYANRKDGGIKDNTYTNIMVAWLLGKTLEMWEKINKQSRDQLIEKMDLKTEELNTWQDITNKINIIIDEQGILAQFDGYFELKELDWPAYKEKYGNICRMDRILKAEGKSPDDYKVAKQADTLMTFYNFDQETVDGIFSSLGLNLPEDYLEKNLAYYLQRTSHGSTLSKIVHARLANMIQDKELSWKLYHDALTSDYQDIQGGTTGEGIHAGVMAGTILVAIQSFAGLNLQGDFASFSPNLPEHWRKISFGFNFKETKYFCVVLKDKIEILASRKTSIIVNGVRQEVDNNKRNII
ncbi:MAG: beta-phosphoglucomutase family hydrolase, partial [Bacteroidetes bacterium]|nr:beta-phosphoglucomutase family hydrolase [Bacteroidota bacterium]